MAAARHSSRQPNASRSRDGTRRGSAAYPALLAFMLLACAAPPDRSDGFAVRDSAGVRIATSGSPAWSEADAWHLGDANLDIGASDNDPDHELFRVMGASRRPDGGVVVANAGSGELRFYAADGSLVRRVGGRGEGPGEFGRIEGFWPYRGDSLIVWDRDLARLTVFSGEGELGRTFSPDRKGFNPRVLQPLSDGSFVVQDLWINPPGDDRPWPLMNHYSAYDADGVFLDSLPARRAYTAIALPQYRIVSPIFAARAVSAGGGDGFVIGTAEEYELRGYDRQGRLRWITRWAGPDRSASSADVEAYKRAETEGISNENARREWAAALEKLPAEDRFPAYGYMTRSRDGGFWLADYPRPGRENEPWRWTVIAADGHWLGTVTMERAALPLDISQEHIVVLARDDLGVEHVRVHRIQRTTQGD